MNDEIVIPIAVPEEVNAAPTPVFPFLHGYFNKDGWKVSYFSMTMNPVTAADVFVLASEIPEPDEGTGWALEELFQRDIDWKRIEQGLVPYLRDADKPTFFGPLTIAVLPYNPITNGILDSFSDWDGWTPPEPVGGVQKTIQIGPLTFGWFADWENMTDSAAVQGVVQWDQRQLMPVAIDGQHRLAAYKMMNDKPLDRAVLTNHRIPVNFLIFEPEVGFEKPEGNTHSDLSILRTLFIDLNKHAVEVSRARQILLDDNEPQARCVREILSQRLANDVQSLTHTKPTMPLSLVDWHGDTAKFDSGPAITTVLSLDWIVDKIFGRARVTDYMNHSKIRTEIKTFESKLKIELPEAHALLNSCENDERVFTYPEETLRKITKAFGENWVPSLVRIFAEFHPYTDLITDRQNGGSLSAKFSEWVFLKSRKGEKAKAELQEWLQRELMSGGWTEEQFENELNDIQDRKSDENVRLAFAVVFQRAIIMAWLKYIEFTVADLARIEPAEEIIDLDDDPDEEIITLDEDPREDLSTFENHAVRTDEFIEILNKLVSDWPQFLNLNSAIQSVESEDARFWSGSLLKPDDGTIDFTEGAGTRAGQLLFLLIAMTIWDKKYDPQEGTPFEDFWDLVDVVANNDPGEQGFIRVMRGIIKSCIKETSPGLATRITNNAGKEYDQETVIKEIEERLKFIWGKLNL